MPIVVLLIAALVVAELWVLRVAFRESAVWGLLILVLPPLGILYSVMRWDDCKVPLLVSLVALPLLWGQLTADPVALAGGKTADTRELAQRVADAAREYRSETQSVPDDTDALVRAGFLTPAEAGDPWGHSFRLGEFRGDLIVWSMGPDATEEGGDNISFSFDWQD